jgi:hypothetical protein
MCLFLPFFEVHYSFHLHMRNTEFTAWLQGFLSLDPAPTEPLTARQRSIIKAHANLLNAVEEGRFTTTNYWIWCDIEEDEAIDKQTLVRMVRKQYLQKPWPSSNELCYFLQGFFEIADGASVWTPAQRRIVLRELDRNLDGLMPMMIALQQLIHDFHGPEPMPIQHISDSLNSAFLHDVDPSYGFSAEKNAQLRDIHDGRVSTLPPASTS